jgi:hypothetical protein
MDINFYGLDEHLYPNSPKIVALAIFVHPAWICEPKSNPPSQLKHIYRIQSPVYPSQEQLPSLSENPQQNYVSELFSV